MKQSFPPVQSAVQVAAYSDGARKECSVQLIEEFTLEVAINGLHRFDLVCSPNCLRELIVGRLFSDGLIDRASDITSLLIHDGEADITLHRTQHQETEKRTSAVKWELEWIVSMAEMLHAGLPLYGETQSAHSCMLMLEGELLCVMEDLGRHNALDKVIGWAVLHQVNLSRCVVFSSGRLPLDMVQKAVRAGIPVLVSKAKPTVTAVAAAVGNRITLLHAAKDGTIFQFS